MDQLKHEVIKTLLYFDIFSFPLKAEEIHQYCQTSTQLPIIQQALAELVAEGHVQQTGDDFAVREGRRLSELRDKKYRLSMAMMKCRKRSRQHSRYHNHQQ